MFDTSWVALLFVVCLRVVCLIDLFCWFELVVLFGVACCLRVVVGVLLLCLVVCFKLLLDLFGVFSGVWFL